MPNIDIDRNILDNSFYMISLFEKAKKSSNGKNDNISLPDNLEKIDDSKLEAYFEKNLKIISNLKLQKLMYFVELYFMYKYPDENELFDTNWSAWDYGPVNKTLYDYFKKFGSIELSLTDDEKDKMNNLSEINKKCIEEIYSLFGIFSAFDLVSLTHLKGSPWDGVRSLNRYDFQKLNESIIDKKKSIQWFQESFHFLWEDEDDTK